jgi:hypothetical protein
MASQPKKTENEKKIKNAAAYFRFMIFSTNEVVIASDLPVKRE